MNDHLTENTHTYIHTFDYNAKRKKCLVKVISRLENFKRFTVNAGHVLN